jgi:hypothetical protein
VIPLCATRERGSRFLWKRPVASASCHFSRARGAAERAAGRRCADLAAGAEPDQLPGSHVVARRADLFRVYVRSASLTAWRRAMETIPFLPHREFDAELVRSMSLAYANLSGPGAEYEG